MEAVLLSRGVGVTGYRGGSGAVGNALPEEGVGACSEAIEISLQ